MSLKLDMQELLLILSPATDYLPWRNDFVSWIQMILTWLIMPLKNMLENLHLRAIV